MTENNTNTFEQIGIFDDIKALVKSGAGNLTSDELSDIIDRLYEAKRKAVLREEEEKKPEAGKPAAKRWDDHSSWGKFEEDDVIRDVWVKNFAEVCEAIKVRDATNGRGTLPMFAQRLLEKLTKPQTDWRSILNEFFSEETLDYSFSPPDRRFGESPFFLPQLNDRIELDADEIKKVLFMVV